MSDDLQPFEMDSEFARLAAAAVKIPSPAEGKVDIRTVKRERRMAREREERSTTKQLTKEIIVEHMLKKLDKIERLGKGEEVVSSSGGSSQSTTPEPEATEQKEACEKSPEKASKEKAKVDGEVGEKADAESGKKGDAAAIVVSSESKEKQVSDSGVRST